MEDVCTECGFDQSSTPAADVGPALERTATEVADAVRSVPLELLRRRPEPRTWAPIEYLGHLRESMAFHRWLIEQAVAQDHPEVPMVDPDESVAAADYRGADVEDLLGQFHRRVMRLGAHLAALPPGAAACSLTLGDRPITVALIARSAWHECHHHLGDIRRPGGL
ncbi:DinB family protein [Mycolicibacterium flavescens]|uniref:DinB-like domain-containing protein n=1 Tax=Mycolicibacterium flavescens TaxID=1776 RepID=A0A1E3RHF3_MYCFV|nr:DinB family protein [Mycolicibacterium flavescens]MCV7280212.1 DinB family protein [Mycolicibacterium flavescens]ODQ89305.1 hypothetical protein BHQ18_15085 [Mycolicibacterium flavescens]